MNDEEKLARRNWIGGSDVAAILGVSPWKKPIDVFIEKKGLLDGEEVNANRRFLMDLGTALEPVIAGLYERQTDKKLILPSPVQWLHKKFPLLGATPDRFREAENYGVELKSESRFSDKFGEPGTDEIPAHYLLQVAHYMSVLDYDVWDVALLHAGTTFSVYTVKRDKELEEAVTEQVLAWWERHIERDVPPTVDGSEGWSKYLKKKFPVNTGDMITADGDTEKLVDLLRLARLARDKYDAHSTEIENRLKFQIAEHEGITGNFGKITWRKTKDSAKVDWELTFQDFRRAVFEREKDREFDTSKELRELSETIQSIHTMPRQGVRRFLLTEAKESYGDRSSQSRNLPADAPEVQAGDRAGLTEASERRQDGADRAHLLQEKP